MLSKILLGIGIFAAVFAVLIFSGKVPGVGSTSSAPQGEVVIWGTFPETAMNPLLQKFNPQAKTYRVSYVEIPEENFNQALTESLASGRGPDVILAPYQIILAQSSRISIYPVTEFGEKQFKDAYIDGASDVFWTPWGTLAFPVAVEPMVLFYNRRLLSKHGIINPPSYWDEVSSTVLKTTVLNSHMQFLESGIALGAPNTPYAKDIIMTIIAQLGQVPVLKKYDESGNSLITVTANQPVTQGGDVYPLFETIRFFTQFADPNQKTYSWNQFIDTADNLFVAEKLAMYIGYSGELASFKERNPRAEFDIAILPQTREYNSFVTGMRMYGIAVMNTSKNPYAAKTVQAAFASGDIPSQLASTVHGMPPFRSFASSPGLNSVLAKSMLNARGWQDIYQDRSTSYVASMISDILNNRMSVTDAANTFVSRMQDLYTPIK